MWTSVSRLRAYYAKRTLKGELSKVVDLMEGHKEVDLPAGNAIYKALNSDVTKAFSDYQRKCVALGFRKPEFFEIQVGAPKLRELAALANGKPSQGQFGSYAIMLILGGVVFTTLVAFYHDWYLLLTHTANTHWR